MAKMKDDRFVKQIGRLPDDDELFSKILVSEELLTRIIENAWHTAPDNEEIRERLIRISERSAKLREGIKKIFGIDYQRDLN